MAKTMKAAMVRKFKEPLSIEEVPVPEVGRGQILVKIGSVRRLSYGFACRRWRLAGQAQPAVHSRS
jgi:hypothetical protein